jgi:hypothetical protein
MPKGIVGLPAQLGALKKKFFPPKSDPGKNVETIQPPLDAKPLPKSE